MSMMRMSLCVAVLAGVALFGVHAEEAKDNATVKKPRVEKPLPKPEEAVQGTANGKPDDPYSWWRGNYNRISRDIKKMDGEIDIAFVGDSITARWGGENWQKHWGSYKAVNYMDIYDKFLEEDGTISKAVMHDFLHLGSDGYDIWAGAIGGKVKELLGE